MNTSGVALLCVKAVEKRRGFHCRIIRLGAGSTHVFSQCGSDEGEVGYEVHDEAEVSRENTDDEREPNEVDMVTEVMLKY